MSKKWLFLGIFALVAAALVTAQEPLAGADSTGNLTVNVTGFKNDSGVVQIGLFASKDSFEKNREKLRGAIIKIHNKTAKVVFDGIPYGEYAIKLYHDENGDDIINSNFLGVPSEGVGFSNNVKPLFKHPSFEKAKFLLDSGEKTIEIRTFHFF